MQVHDITPATAQLALHPGVRGRGRRGWSSDRAVDLLEWRGEWRCCGKAQCRQSTLERGTEGHLQQRKLHLFASLMAASGGLEGV